MARQEIAPARRLWVKLAIFGALGIVLTHAIQLVVASRTTTHALGAQLVSEGQTLARFVARRGADAVLEEDFVALQELVDGVTRASDVAYCFVQRGSVVLASSFRRGTPTKLLSLGGPRAPLLVRAGRRRFLDVSEPVGRGDAGRVRVGLRIEVLDAPLRRQALALGLVAFCIVLMGAGAAFVIGRRVARPVDEMVATLEGMDPAIEPLPLPERSQDEVGLLTRKVNEMRTRLHGAHREQEQARRRQMQTEKLAALGSLVAGVAHEVNNPLAGLKNCRSRLAKGDLSPERRSEYLELMAEGLERIEAAVQQLLDFSRIRKPSRSSAQLGRLLASTQGLVKPALKGKRVELALELGESASQALDVDPHQVEQALTNLLLNAIYATPKGGTIRVTTAQREGLLGIVIEDQGPGIPAELLAQIEDPFFTTKPEGEGTGLGLSVTRTIADAHDGDLTFECPSGGGTRAIFWLPV